MSSFIRRLQIRAIEKRGYDRAAFKLVRNARGNLEQVPVRRGGVILDPESKPIGYNWPRFLPKSEPLPPREKQKAKRRRQRRIAVPANPVRSTRREREPQHRAKMIAKGHRRPPEQTA